MCSHTHTHTHTQEAFFHGMSAPSGSGPPRCLGFTIKPRNIRLGGLWTGDRLHRTLPDNTQHSQETDIHSPGGIRTRNLSRWTAADTRPKCKYLYTYSMEQSPSWEANRIQLLKKFPAFYGTRRFIIAITSARHQSLSWASSIQSCPQHFA